MKIRSTLTALTLLTFFYVTEAQVAENSELFRTLKKLDSTFFERGFNLCDVGYLEKTVSKNLRFYHDQGGFQDRDKFLDNTKKYICGDGTQKPIRQVEEVSLKVFPMYNNGVLYAAIQSGVHHFFLREEGKKDVWTSKAKFTHVWVVEAGDWKLSEVLSYDHQSTR